MSLDALNEQVWRDLAQLNYTATDWVRPRNSNDGHVYDVVIVGGGQCGLGVAFGLLRERISNILVIDENPAGAEGPWETYARMVTLRTPKHLTSIDLGIPSLTFRAWWEAQHGTESWQAIDKIPRGDWMDYLRWYRRILALPVTNDARLTQIEPNDDGLYRLRVDGMGVVLARKIVLATGIQGGGEWHVPREIADALPSSCYAHAAQAIDFGGLTGKRVGLLGGGASAFDNAQFALSSGVAEAHVFVRRDSLPRINPIRQMEQSGLIERFTALGDAEKYAVMAHFFRHNQPPTNDTYQRAAAWPGFKLHLGSPWRQLSVNGRGVTVTTPKGQIDLDFLIICTGLITDPALRPELRLVDPDIVRWRDRYTPPVDIANPLIDAHPYLSAGFEFLARDAAGSARLQGIFAFNYSALISLGLAASALSGLRFGIPKLVKALADSLFLDDRAAILQDFFSYADAEFIGETPGA